MGATRVGTARTATVVARGPLVRAHDWLLRAGWRWRWHGWALYVPLGAWLLAAVAHVAGLGGLVVLGIVLPAVCAAVFAAVLLDVIPVRYWWYAAVTSVWVLLASVVRPWSLVALVAAVVLLGPAVTDWIRYLGTGRKTEITLPELVEEWDRWVTPKILPGTELVEMRSVDRAERVTATVAFPRETGQTWRHARAKTMEITAALRYDEGTIFFGEHETPGHATMRVFRTNPLATPAAWPGPSFNPETGIFDLGPYIDGTIAGMRTWASHGAVHGLVVGLTGTGKSGFYHLQLREDFDSGLIVPIFLDPQSGQSAPEWTGHIPTVHGVQHCVETLEALAAHVMARSGLLGKMRLGKYRFKDLAKHELAPLDIVVDEWPMLAKDGRFGSRAVAAADTIAATGRKAGVRLVTAGQSPLLSEFGAGTALRENLDAGGALMFRLGGVSAGAAIGGDLSRDAAMIPQYLRGRVETSGFAYVKGVDGSAEMLRVWDPATIPNPDKQGPAKGPAEVSGITAHLIASLPDPTREPGPIEHVQITPPPAPRVVRPDGGAKAAIVQVVTEAAQRGKHVTTAQLVEALAERWAYAESSVHVARGQLARDNASDPDAGIAQVARGVWTLPAPVTVPKPRSDS